MFIRKTLAFADKYGMLPEGGAVLAAVSGGADSVCLLHALSVISKERGFSLFAAHYNHNLRGDESEGDEAFVRELCEKLGVPLFVGSGDVSGEAERTGRGVEETARSMRYAFFNETAKAHGMTYTATAHSADDNAETVIMNLVRGGGARGLSGIPPVRGDIIRPVLWASRADIEAYLSENGLSHREDSSNASDDYTRNRIRHSVIPLLKEQNPAFCSAVLQSSELLREDDRLLDSMAAKFAALHFKNGRLPASELSALPKPIASRVVRLVCDKSLSARHVEAVLAIAAGDDPSASVDIPSVTVRREYDALVFGAAETLSFEPFSIDDGTCADIPGTGYTVSCKKDIFSPNVHKRFNTFLFKCEDVCGKMLVRPRIEGDFAALSGGRTKTLKKLFIEKKIPAHMRALIPVLSDDNGVLAVCGLGQTKRGVLNNGDPVYIIMFEKRCVKDDK